MEAVVSLAREGMGDEEVENKQREEKGDKGWHLKGYEKFRKTIEKLENSKVEDRGKGKTKIAKFTSVH